MAPSVGVLPPKPPLSCEERRLKIEEEAVHALAVPGCPLTGHLFLACVRAGQLSASCLWHAWPPLTALVWVFSQVGIALKPFLPQLQTTFTKALQDSNRGVRLKAADALGKLISIHIKVDPLFTELLNGIRVMEDPGVR